MPSITIDNSIKCVQNVTYFSYSFMLFLLIYTLQPYRLRLVSNTKVNLFNQYTETNSNKASIYWSHIPFMFEFIF